MIRKQYTGYLSCLDREYKLMDELLTETPEMQEILTDWFETIEEIELSPTDKQLLIETSESLTALKNAASEMGIQAEDFDDWFNLDVLEQWSGLMEDLEYESGEAITAPVPAFHRFIQDSEQRLYLQMLKRCIPAATSESA